MAALARRNTAIPSTSVTRVHTTAARMPNACFQALDNTTVIATLVSSEMAASARQQICVRWVLITVLITQHVK